MDFSNLFRVRLIVILSTQLLQVIEIVYIFIFVSNYIIIKMCFLSTFDSAMSRITFIHYVGMDLTSVPFMNTVPGCKKLPLTSNIAKYDKNKDALTYIHMVYIHGKK